MPLWHCAQVLRGDSRSTLVESRTCGSSNTTKRAPNHQWINHSSHAAAGFYSIKMQGVKLFVAPLLFRVSRQMQRRDFCSLGQFVRIEAFPLPLTVDHRVAKGPSMGPGHSLPVVVVLVLIVMALSA